MTDSEDAQADAPPDATVETGEQTNPNGVGPFSVREVALLGVWVLAFIVSFFPVAGVGTPTVWTSNLVWILTIGVPTVAVGLVMLRRFSPDGIRRVGSLGVDQFASVAFSVAAVVWLQYVWAAVSLSIEVGGFPGGWVQWVELVLMLAGVVLTVFAPFLPVLGGDFTGRPEVAAHRVARPVLPVSARPTRERAPKEPKPPREPKAPRGPRRTGASEENAPWDQNAFAPAYDQGFGPQGYDTGGYTQQPYDQNASSAQGFDPSTAQAGPSSGAQPVAGGVSDTSPTGGYAPVQSQPEQQPTAEQPTVTAQQAFWALAPVERDVVDQNGAPLFRIGPTAWALVIEDRGTAFVVRDEDGRTGYLLDVSGVMRG